MSNPEGHLTLEQQRNLAFSGTTLWIIYLIKHHRSLGFSVCGPQVISGLIC